MRQIELDVQAYWRENRIFEADAPSASSANGEKIPEKYFATFPYPYMNGRLHLGHTFTLSKAEFAVGFEKMRGKRTLFPLAFHCTGMPIKAAADKLKREIAARSSSVSDEAQENQPTEASEAKKTHSKVAAKTGNAKSQWEIMEQLDVPRDEIPRFADPAYWLEYFPIKTMQDVQTIGFKVDWRRSFITTDRNPYYDSFIRWQFNKLRAQNKIKFGKRHTIYSPFDRQACLDHDRQSGEGVGPQEYTLVKMRVVSDELTTKFPVLKGFDVFLGAATLRPETMYAQTNCWVGPDITYGAYKMATPNEIIVMTERAARNMSYQGLMNEEGCLEKVAEIKAIDLIGVALCAPNAIYYEKIYVLPMLTVTASKGTGIVTSVPSDSPDDYAALNDLREKPALRAKFGVPDNAVLPFEPKPVLSTATYGEMTAPVLISQLCIKSQNDRDLLAKAKELAYSEGFYKGTMSVGPYAGTPVQQAKTLIKADMIAAGNAFVYYEPEGVVISRSGDECVVCLTDQWYITYGEEEWRQLAGDCLARMNLYHDEARNQFEKTLDWLNQWACSRSFGLGSKLPWDAQYLIESLSDSTIYMAFYTVAHILQQGSFDGRDLGDNAAIKPEQMTDEVWDYIFQNSCSVPTDCIISKELLDRMKNEFEYFYPVDLRVSGKDLIPNHLTFFIYIHTAMFPPKFWPRAVRGNGHLLLNNEKMSKSTGNFMTLVQSVSEFTADATRLAMADAGDELDDANFATSTCNAAILNLYNLLEFFKQAIDAMEDAQKAAEYNLLFKDASAEFNFNDKVFDCEMNVIVEKCYTCYENMRFRDVVVNGYHELQKARDRYREITKGSSGMHPLLVRKFIDCFTLLMSPIIPHFCEHVWRNVLHHKSSVTLQPWPVTNVSVNSAILAARDYVCDVARDARLSLHAEQHPKKGAPPKHKLDAAQVYVSTSLPDWQQRAVEILRANFDSEKSAFETDDKIVAELRNDALLKPHLKKAMPFAMELKKKASVDGIEALNKQLPFNEVETIACNLDYLCRTLELTKITILDAKSPEISTDLQKKAASSLPGAPSFSFYATAASE